MNLITFNSKSNYIRALLAIIISLLISCTKNSDLQIDKNNKESQIFQIEKLLNNRVNTDQTLAGITKLKEMKRLSTNRKICAFLCNTIAEELSFIGNYKESLLYMDKYNDKTSTESLIHHDLIKDGYEPKDAVEHIESVASSTQVIFINEAHHAPLHRAFSTILLEVLYNKGFRYFAAETLNSIDTNLQKRGYPLLNVSGYYTNESLYGNLIRTALRLGYTVIPYENEVPCEKSITTKDVINEDFNSDTFDWKCQNLREYNQALNLYKRILEEDPKAKIFVHAGYGHIRKTGTETWTPMGVYFQRISGIFPYVIDQETMREHSTPEFENESYKYISNKYQFNNPIILQSSDHKTWVNKEYQGQYDAQIIHPRTTMIYGRPHWLSLNGSRLPYYVNNINTDTNFPYLVTAYINNEEPLAVPIDKIVLSDKNEHKALMLPNGDFKIIIKDKSGKLIDDYSITIPFKIKKT